MSVVSRSRRQKSWQIADELVSLLDGLEDERESFGKRLRDLARAHGLDSDEDAARLIGVSYRQYQRWLSGESVPRMSSMKRIADAYGVALGELIGVPDEAQLDRIESELKRQGVMLAALSRALAESEGEEVDQLVEEIEREQAHDDDQPGEEPGRDATDGPSRPKR